MNENQFASHDKTNPRGEYKQAEDTQAINVERTTSADTNENDPTEDEPTAKRRLSVFEWVMFTAWPRAIRPTFKSSGFWTAAATVAIAVATFVYVHYAKRQWQAMSEQLLVMQRTLKLTQNQLESASGAVVYAWRPFSFVTPTDIAINLRNSGHTTATNLHGILDLSFFSVPSGEPVGKSIHRSLDVASIGPFNRSDPNGGNSHYQWRIPYTISKQEAQSMAAGEIGMRANLSLSYNDGFAVVKNDNCYIRLGFTIKNPYFNSTGGGSSECSDLSNTLPSFYSALKNARKQAAIAAGRHKRNGN